MGWIKGKKRNGKAVNRSEIVGQKFNQWTVLEYVRTDGKIAFYKCACDCGRTTTEVRGYNLRSGRSKGCELCGRARTTAAAVGVDRSIYTAEDATLLNFYREYVRRNRKYPQSGMISFLRFKELVYSNCYYTGRPPSIRMNRTTKKRPEDMQIRKERYDAGWVMVNTIDRIDSSKGYEEGNVVPCCNDANKAKSALSQEDFLKLCNDIARKHPR